MTLGLKHPVQCAIYRRHNTVQKTASFLALANTWATICQHECYKDIWGCDCGNILPLEIYCTNLVGKGLLDKLEAFGEPWPQLVKESEKYGRMDWDRASPFRLVYVSRDCCCFWVKERERSAREQWGHPTQTSCKSTAVSLLASCGYSTFSGLWFFVTLKNECSSADFNWQLHPSVKTALQNVGWLGWYWLK